MKRLLLISISLFTVIISLCAQPGGGGGRGPGGGGGRGSRGAPDGQMPRQASVSEELFMLENFPEIPDLTLEQRREVSSLLYKERKDIDKQIRQRHKLEREMTPDLSLKEVEKKRKKIADIDKKIVKTREKYNKKIKKKLSDEQYLTFLRERDKIQFVPYHTPQGRSSEGQRQGPGQGQQGGPQGRPPGGGRGF